MAHGVKVVARATGSGNWLHVVLWWFHVRALSEILTGDF